MPELHNEKQMLPEELKHQELKKYLQKEISQHQNSARLKSILAHLLFWIVIIASALGLLNIATNNSFPKLLMAGITIIPGIALLISNTFKYEARAKWHKLKQRKLEGLCRKLMFEDGTVNEISKEITIVLEELDKIRIELEKPVTSR